MEFLGKFDYIWSFGKYHGYIWSLPQKIPPYFGQVVIRIANQSVKYKAMSLVMIDVSDQSIGTWMRIGITDVWIHAI